MYIYIYIYQNLTDILGSSTLALAMFDCQTVISDDIPNVPPLYIILLLMVNRPVNCQTLSTTFFYCYITILDGSKHHHNILVAYSNQT